MVSPKHVCVIGAGVSGLAAAKAFSTRGHRVTIVERSADLGGVWEPARSYPEVQTQSPKDLYRYTDRAMPESYPEWPTGPQVHAYLADYAKGHGLDRMLRLDTKVESMARRADGEPGWTLALTDKNGATSNEDFDFVAVCTGQFNEPQELHCPGEDGFMAQGGQILHSSKYNDPALAKNCRVVVLGGSKSATDIAVNAVRSGAREVTIVFREQVWRIPYFIGGLVNFKRIIYIRAQEQMFQGWDASPMARLAHRVAAPLVWANWRGLESLLKAQLKLKKCNMMPKARIEDGVNCSVPIAELLSDGRRWPHQGDLRHLRPL
jgi:cation diffusion facilitator CzcD-associated flavoprotein CzcO